MKFVTESLATNVLKTLVTNRDQFLEFLLLRVGTREAAEDILQAAFLKTLERGDEIRDQESAVAWFYRVLRHAVVDHHRRHAVEVRTTLSVAQESPVATEAPGLGKTVCQCVRAIIPTLKEEYAGILLKVDMEGVAIADIAKIENISPNNAMVRLHRARKALHERLLETCGPSCTETGCLDCHCGDHGIAIRFLSGPLAKNGDRRP
jgi:RNA polymerase sigma-70 factor (ECF subfamily)